MTDGKYETLYEVVPEPKPQRAGTTMAQVVKAWRKPGGAIEVNVGFSNYTPAQAVLLGQEIVKAGEIALEAERVAGKKCPDGGTCHHSCEGTDCFRVQCCGPLSGVYPADVWPDAVRRAYGAARRMFTVTYESPGNRNRTNEHEVEAWHRQDAIWQTARWLAKYPQVLEGAVFLDVRENDPQEDSEK